PGAGRVFSPSLVPSMSLLRPRLVLFFLAFLVGTSCEAQALGGNTPGEFDYYVLVLGWAPSYCLSEGRLRRDAECNSAKPHAFVLHGYGRNTRRAGQRTAL